MRNSRCGMTLFEVTIVMLIMGIVAAVAAPRFANSFINSKLVSAGNQISAHIEFVRRTAVNEGRPTTFTLDSTTDTYSSTEVDLPSKPGTLMSVNVKEVHDPDFELSGGFDGQSTVTFDYEGVPYAGTTPLVDGTVSVAYGGQSITIRIATGTGKTSIVSGGS